MHNRFKFTEDNPLRVFTAFSGYDSQCMALDRIGIPYTLVGWSEIDKIQTAVFPNKNDVVPIRYGLPEEGSKEKRISDSQQYKMAGNSIVVDCLSGIFNNLFTNEEIEKDTLF